MLVSVAGGDGERRGERDMMSVCSEFVMYVYRIDDSVTSADSKRRERAIRLFSVAHPSTFHIEPFVRGDQCVMVFIFFFFAV